MKTLFTMIIMMALIGCAQTEPMPQTNSVMTGTPVRGQIEAYQEMCHRNPGSPLCPEAIPTTASDLNAHWCDMCEQNQDIFVWCQHLSCRNHAQHTQPKTLPAQTNPMQGTPVRVRAQAYQEMCDRNPGSILCPEE